MRLVQTFPPRTPESASFVKGIEQDIITLTVVRIHKIPRQIDNNGAVDPPSDLGKECMECVGFAGSCGAAQKDMTGFFVLQKGKLIKHEVRSLTSWMIFAGFPRLVSTRKEAIQKSLARDQGTLSAFRKAEAKPQVIPLARDSAKVTMQICLSIRT